MNIQQDRDRLEAEMRSAIAAIRTCFHEQFHEMPIPDGANVAAVSDIIVANAFASIVADISEATAATTPGARPERIAAEIMRRSGEILVRMLRQPKGTRH